MLVIIDKNDSNNMTPMMLDDDEWFVTHAYNGDDELQFTISDKSGYYGLFEEESKILAIGLRGNSNRFVVKNIDSHDGIVTVDCDIDLYDWQQTIFDTYGGGSARTLDKVLQDVTPSGWSYSGQEQFGDSEVFQTGSREPVKAGTPLDVLDIASEVYGCVFNFDNIANHLYVIDPNSYTPVGDFLSDEVNLKALGYVGNSEGYATRLYPYGKRDDDGNNPVTIESVNDGLPYVTNNEFSEDVICVGWSDERYTDPDHLKEAAIARLAELAKPTRSYECDVSQLDRNVWLYMVLTMIDRQHRTRTDQQVVEWKEYGRPDLDVVTLSAVAPSIESLIKSADEDNDAIYQYVNDIANNVTDDYKQAIKDATDKITGNDGGHFLWIFDDQGRPIELVNLNESFDVNDAKSVWRWNQSGLGHSNNGYDGPYDLAILADGSINASVITVGILRGGQSHWNLNTGDLDIVGTFQTRADDSMDGSNTLYGVKISPEFSQEENTGGDSLYGSGILFTGDTDNGNKRVQLPYVATEMYTEQEGLVSTVVINGGRLSDEDPGTFARFGVRKDDGSEKLYATTFIESNSKYTKEDTERAYIAVRSDKLNESTGVSDGFIYSTMCSSAGNTNIGVEAMSRGQNGSLIHTLYLGGVLSGFTGMMSLPLIYWEGPLSISSFQVGTYTATLSTPAKFGRYKAFANADMTMSSSDMHGLSVTVGNAGASGWMVYLFTMPGYVNAKTNEGDSWGMFKLWNGGSKSFYLNSFGYLIS